MNLEDVIDPEYGLQQDEWSLSRPRFGDEGQLEVVGWSGRCKGGKGHKFYILKCNKCSQDSELFGDGYFRAAKGNLVNQGQIPCGCSTYYWSSEQYSTLCRRKAEEIGYEFLGFEGKWEGRKNTKVRVFCEKVGYNSVSVITLLGGGGLGRVSLPKESEYYGLCSCKADELGYKFLGFEGEYEGVKTKIKMLCEKHGEWNTGVVRELLHRGAGCPRCRDNRKPNNVIIESFFKTGAFHSDTKFWRSERKDSRGYRSYWYMSCPECGENGESTSSHLQRGCRPCACSKQRQQECYINWLIDDHNMAVAIKFGIANNSKRRLKEQDSKSAYTLKQHSIYQFPDVASCKQAERECKKELECGVVLKRDMPDGYSETTWAYNIAKVKAIYERNGGVLQNTTG